MDKTTEEEFRHLPSPQTVALSQKLLTPLSPITAIVIITAWFKLITIPILMQGTRIIPAEQLDIMGF